MGNLNNSEPSNFQDHKWVSDQCDHYIWGQESERRSQAHGYYNKGVGHMKYYWGNKDGAENEYKKAQEHFTSAKNYNMPKQPEPEQINLQEIKKPEQ